MPIPTGAPAVVVVVEDNLRDDRGHFGHFVRGLAELLRPLGSGVEVWAHREAALPMPSHVSLRALFSRSSIEAAFATTRFRRIVAVLRQNAELLWWLWRCGGFSRRSHLFLATSGTLYHLAAWRIWLALAPRSSRLVVFVHDLPWLIARDGARPRLQPIAAVYRIVLRAFRGYAQKGRCAFIAETPRQGKLLHRLGALPVSVVPVPVTAAVLAQEVLPVARPPDRRLRFGLIGRMAAEKGIESLIAAILHLRHTRRARRVTFVFQWFDAPDVGSKWKQDLVALQAACPESIDIVEGSLPPADYAAMFGQLDAILLPYRVRDYYERGSGLAAEAFCTGRPVVCTAGTSMARAIGRWGAGVVFREGSAEALAAAIVELAEHYDTFLACARRQMQVAREAHAWERLLTVLPDLSGQSAPLAPLANHSVAQ